MVMLRVEVRAGPEESVTSTVKVHWPAIEGMPATVPSDERPSPGGSVPPVCVKT